MNKRWHVPLEIRELRFYLFPILIDAVLILLFYRLEYMVLFRSTYIFYMLYSILFVFIKVVRPFDYRLNDFFIIRRFGLSKYGVIYQRTNKKKVRHMNCSQAILEMSSQKDIMINQLYAIYLKNPNVVYLTITHDTIRKRLKKLPNIKILVDDAYYERNLIKTQSNLVGRKCKKCIDKDKCKLHQRSQKRTFYYIKFVFTK